MTHTQLPRRPFGKTGLAVTQLGFGAAEMRGPDAYRGRPVTEEQCQAIVQTVLEAGINFIDTADDYGLSEERLGRLLRGRRDQVILASKCGYAGPPVQPGGIVPRRDLGRENLWRGLERSLRRLGTDHLDILQLHNPKPQEVIEANAVDTMLEMKRRGMVRWIGVSTGLADVRAYFEMGVFDVFQLPYSLFDHRCGEWMDRIGDAGGAIIVRNAAGRGGTTRAIKEFGSAGYPPPPDLWTLAGLDDFLHDHQRMELILRYSLSHRYTHTAVVGTINPDHLLANVQAAQCGPLPREVLERIDARLDEVQVTHLEPWRAECRAIRQAYMLAANSPP
ncbi:MAG: aldo/keto reductase [Phycisphaeraceae bacterium]|nr:aldo/keto reductase [Phycisphaeraceae bacterium]